MHRSAELHCVITQNQGRGQNIITAGFGRAYLVCHSFGFGF